MRQIALLMVAAAGCYEVWPDFVCERDEQCAAGAEPGFCEPAPHRFCSHSDGTCGSGRRFRERAGDRLGGVCVDPRDDLGVADQRMPDLSMEDAIPTLDMSPDMATPCLLPWLLVAIENLNGQISDRGSVIKYSLASDPPQRCRTYDASGFLEYQPWALAFFPPSSLVVALRSTPSLLRIIDTDTDLTVRTIPTMYLNPFNVFPLKNPANSETLIAVATGQLPSEVDRIEAFKPDGTLVKTLVPSSTFTINPVHGATASLLDPTHLFVLSRGGAGAWDADPWNPSKTKYANDSALDNLDTIEALLAGTSRRTAWSTQNPGGGLYYIDESSATPPISPSGILQCATPPATMCTFLHAVPDPTKDGRFFAICDDVNGVELNQRYVIRVEASSCITVNSGLTLPTNRHRQTRLAIAR